MLFRSVGDFTDSLMLNQYAYAKSSPLNYVDLSGHEREYGWSDYSRELLADLYEYICFTSKLIKDLYA